MSSSIWTRCAGDSELRPLRLSPWRAVEAQHLVSTRKLVDTRAEQELLEQLIDRVKPPAAPGAAGAPKRHYLLTTPFRYPPLPHGSRFGTRGERGIWYGAESRATLFAEVAYYRMVFLEGTRADLGAVSTQVDAFRVTARSARGIDLTAAPFAKHAKTIASPTSYAESQALGRAMRDAGVELFRYPSARDPGRGTNVGAFTPGVFGKAKPRDLETWHCLATRELVELTKRDYVERAFLSFPRSTFLVEGRLPAPAI
jgi:hypothetical protein